MACRPPWIWPSAIWLTSAIVRGGGGGGLVVVGRASVSQVQRLVALGEVWVDVQSARGSSGRRLEMVVGGNV